MPEPLLPRIIKLKLAAEPKKAFITITGTLELSKMIGLPPGLPPVAVARQFMADFSNGKVCSDPVLVMHGSSRKGKG